jgi:hypothetical protein
MNALTAAMPQLIRRVYNVLGVEREEKKEKEYTNNIGGIDWGNIAT